MPTSDVAYTGEISMYAFPFAPTNWLRCNGALLMISQHQALFALLSDNFGGDGRTTFATPNMNSRAPVGSYAGGSTLGLSTFSLGEYRGAQATTLTTSNLPQHTHQAVFTPVSTPSLSSLSVYNGGADKATPAAGDLIAASGDARFRAPGGFGEPAQVEIGGVQTSTGGISGTVTIAGTGSSAPFSIQNPILAVNFSICSSGLFPPRS
ncbi:MAG: tail fiber protein [Alphaproteobacteria bacterium]|nr:tail fiber protein [Alphaproteobacteria bacterium]